MIRAEPAPAGDNTLLSWSDELDQLDAQIKALQDSKRDFYAAIRDNHGKTTADALKAAQRIRGMDSEKRAKAEQVDAETARILAVLERGRAPRAMRAYGNIEQIGAKVEVGIPATLPAHDAVTGEIRNEPEAAAEVAGDYLREPAAAEQGQIVREGDAPRETGRFGGDASSPDTEYQDGEAAPLSDGLAGPACAQDAEAANTKPAPIPEPFTPPAFLLKEAKPLRPHCQRPDLCGGYGKVHCGTCERAAKAKEAA